MSHELEGASFGIAIFFLVALIIVTVHFLQLLFVEKVQSGEVVDMDEFDQTILGENNMMYVQHPVYFVIYCVSIVDGKGILREYKIDLSLRKTLHKGQKIRFKYCFAEIKEILPPKEIAENNFCVTAQ